MSVIRTAPFSLINWSFSKFLRPELPRFFAVAATVLPEQIPGALQTFQSGRFRSALRRLSRAPCSNLAELNTIFQSVQGTNLPQRITLNITLNSDWVKMSLHDANSSIFVENCANFPVTLCCEQSCMHLLYWSDNVGWWASPYFSSSLLVHWPAADGWWKLSRRKKIIISFHFSEACKVEKHTHLW